MNEPREVREQVSRAYTAAIQRDTGCCGGSCGTGSRHYDASDLVDLPKAPSYGCGDPLAFSEVREGQTVLDLGSGAGLDLLVAARKVGPTGHVIGVDMTDAMIEAARENIAEAGFDHVEVRKGLIEDLPVETASVDWVISNCVINLSPEKPRVFAEIARVLKPGGTMLVSDIVADELPEWVRGTPAFTNACIGGAVPEADYLDGLRAAGLVDVEVVDRVTYGSETILDFIRSDFPQAAPLVEGIWPQLEPLFANKVHSIRVRARRA